MNMSQGGNGAARHSRKRLFSPGRLIAGIAITAAIIQAFRIRRELRDYRALQERLRESWAIIASKITGGALRIRALIGTQMASELPPIVLVHGYGIGVSYWVPLAAQLADYAMVYAPELPGHGRSDHDVRPLTISEQAAALGAWMDTVPMGHALLVGHSLGCQIAAELAASRPELVSGLVLIGPSDRTARTPAEQILRGIRGSAYERSSFAVWTVRDYRRAGGRVLREELHQMVRQQLERTLSRINLPVRVLRGERDRLVSQEWAETVARIAKAPAPTVIARWGHAVHYDDPASVAPIIIDLAKSIHLTGISISISESGGAEALPTPVVYPGEIRPEHYAG